MKLLELVKIGSLFYAGTIQKNRSLYFSYFMKKQFANSWSEIFLLSRRKTFSYLWGKIEIDIKNTRRSRWLCTNLAIDAYFRSYRLRKHSRCQVERARNVIVLKRRSYTYLYMYMYMCVYIYVLTHKYLVLVACYLLLVRRSRKVYAIHVASQR